MDQLQYTYNDLKDNNEIAIVERYEDNAKCYTTMLTSKTIPFIFIFIYLFYVWNILTSLKFL